MFGPGVSSMATDVRIKGIRGESNNAQLTAATSRMLVHGGEQRRRSPVLRTRPMGRYLFELTMLLGAPTSMQSVLRPIVDRSCCRDQRLIVQFLNRLRESGASRRRLPSWLLGVEIC